MNEYVRLGTIVFELGFIALGIAIGQSSGTGNGWFIFGFLNCVMAAVFMITGASK